MRLSVIGSSASDILRPQSWISVFVPWMVEIGLHRKPSELKAVKLTDGWMESKTHTEPTARAIVRNYWAEFFQKVRWIKISYCPFKRFDALAESCRRGFHSFVKVWTFPCGGRIRVETWISVKCLGGKPARGAGRNSRVFTLCQYLAAVCRSNPPLKKK